MQKYATVDTAQFPTVRIAFTGNKANDENFDTYLQETRQLYDRQQQLAIIFDATNAVVPALKYQKQQADWLKDNKSLMENYCKGTAYVIPNAIIRTVLKAIFSFQKQPVPYKVVGTVEDATDWVKDL